MSQPLIHVATRAVRAASRVLFRQFEKLEDASLNTSRRQALALKVEREVANELAQQVQHLYPKHNLCFAKAQPEHTLAEHRWIIDAIDADNNLERGLPHFAMTLAYQRNGVTTAAVVHNPIQDETFSAIAGEGALLGQKRIRCNEQVKHLESALFASGSGHNEKQAQRIAVSINNLINKHIRGSYCSGSDSLDIAYVAAGRLDGYWALRSETVDLSAALLIAKEAGAFTTSLKGDDASGLNCDLLVCHPKLHKQVIKLLHAV